MRRCVWLVQILCYELKDPHNLCVKRTVVLETCVKMREGSVALQGDSQLSNQAETAVDNS